MKLLSKNRYLKDRVIIKIGIGEVNMFLMKVGRNGICFWKTKRYHIIFTCFSERKSEKVLKQNKPCAELSIQTLLPEAVGLDWLGHTWT